MLVSKKPLYESDLDLDTQTWPRYGQDIPPYQEWSFYVKASKSCSPKTDTQTDEQ